MGEGALDDFERTVTIDARSIGTSTTVLGVMDRTGLTPGSQDKLRAGTGNAHGRYVVGCFHF